VFSGSIEPVPAVSAVVVALGGGITADGVPHPATVARARSAAGLYCSGRAQRIVMSGAYGMYDPPPPRAEATAMAEIAVAAGVPPGSITAETRSRDTIGNIWFTKPLLGEPAGQSVIVVTSGWHAARVRYLAQVIWGPGFQVAIQPLTREAGTRPPEEIARWEAGLLAVSRRWFAAVSPGDDAAIAAVLARDHPVYAGHPRTTLAELAATITRHPPDRGLDRQHPGHPVRRGPGGRLRSQRAWPAARGASAIKTLC
jgi:vancomycin permeability regulator SanA